MGWASGIYLFEDVWELLRPFVPEHDRVAMLSHLIRLFEDNDCDTFNDLDYHRWPELKDALGITGWIEDL